MKSRKAQKRSSSSSNKSVIRRSVQRSFETLEDRRLMTVQPWSDGKYYFPGGENRAELQSTADYARWEAISKIQFADYIGNGSAGEGAGPATTVSEVEPNSTFGTAQFINLGNLPGQFQQADVLGTLPRLTFDEDYYAVDLKAGDILDARIAGIPGIYDLAILNSSRVEIGGNQTPIIGGYPGQFPADNDPTINSK